MVNRENGLYDIYNNSSCEEFIWSILHRGKFHFVHRVPSHVCTSNLCSGNSITFVQNACNKKNVAFSCGPSNPLLRHCSWYHINTWAIFLWPKYSIFLYIKYEKYGRLFMDSCSQVYCHDTLKPTFPNIWDLFQADNIDREVRSASKSV